MSAQLQRKEKKKFMIEERRRRVTTMLAQSMTEIEIAKKLNVHVSTISRDVTYLKKQSQQFVYDLAKSDLAFFYKQCLDGIEEVRRKSWDMHNNKSKKMDTREKLPALKLIKECNESKFSLFKEGPSIMNLQSLEERLKRIESTRQIN